MSDKKKVLQGMCHTPEEARIERSWHNISEQKSSYLQMATSDALLPSFPPSQWWGVYVC